MNATSELLVRTRVLQGRGSMTFKRRHTAQVAREATDHVFELVSWKSAAQIVLTMHSVHGACFEVSYISNSFAIRPQRP